LTKKTEDNWQGRIGNSGKVLFPEFADHIDVGQTRC